MVLQQPSYFDLLQTDLTVNLAVLSIQRGGNDKNFFENKGFGEFLFIVGGKTVRLMANRAGIV